MNKPQEWNERMKPFREMRKELFCKTSNNRRIMKLYTKIDIISGLMEMGYSESEALHHFNVIEEKNKLGLMERNGEE